MAITSSTQLATGNQFISHVTATADADTSLAIPHGLGAAPLEVTLTGLLAEARLSAWIVSGIDATNVTILKDTAVGSGAAGQQLKLIVKRPHSATR